MIKIIKNTGLFILLAISFTLSAQTNTSSPYSQFGLGDIQGSLLPQFRAMGGISTGIHHIGFLNNINISNPASYADIRLTTFDIGIAGSISHLSNSSVNQKGSFNASLSHIAFAIPVTKRSALSFGLLPYSNLGYQYKVSSKIDTNKVDYIYSGDGGLSKAYLGYGFQLGKQVSIGFNASYIFGKLNSSQATEDPDYTSVFLDSRTEKSSSLGGLSFDYGLQYYTNLSPKNRLTIGYSGSAGNKINSTMSSVTTRYSKDPVTGDDLLASDTTFFTESSRIKIKLPMTNSIGFSYDHANKLLLGVDFTMSNWSEYRVGSTNPNLKNSYGIAAGGQLTPDPASVTNYFKLIDYRLGLKYNKTFISIKNNDIKQAALTLGLGLPLPSNRSTFYKINFSAEIGKRGTVNNNLVRERYVNFNLGFTINDKWFQKTYIE